MANVKNSQLKGCIHQIAVDTAQKLYFHFTPEMAQHIYNLIEYDDTIQEYCDFIEREVMSILAGYTKTYILSDIWTDKEKETKNNA